MADNRHVPQGRISAEDREASLAAVRHEAAKDWTALLARALTVREEWDHAAAELDESEAEPGPNDGPWNAWHVLNHVGGFTACDAASLRALAAGEPAEIDPSLQWQGDDKTFLELRSGAIAGWDDYIAAVTEATIMQPDGGTAVHRFFGPLSARECIAFTLSHARDHARQMRALRGLEEGENPGDSAGDLGRRRQTAH